MLFTSGITSIIFALGLFIEYIGVAIVVFSALLAVYRLLVKRVERDIIRVNLAKNVMFGLEFIIAADILIVTTATSINQIWQLGAIVIIRILLGYALQKDGNIK
jgi:uncharacterized membrane protein